MAGKSKIEWTDASWTPIRARNLKTGKVGWHCEHATTGCINCYSESMNKRLGTGLPFKPGHRSHVKLYVDDKMLVAPLRWKKPRMIFVCSMTDLFADFVKDEWIDRVFDTMEQADWHTYQILTKRAQRMRDYMIARFAKKLDYADRFKSCPTPEMRDSPAARDARARATPEFWKYIWLGVSAERQQEWDERKEHLRQTPAAVHFASFEPLLGGIVEPRIADYIQWAIVGGESGPKARPMHPDWARGLRDQCEAADVPFFFKQWGEWASGYRNNMGARDMVFRQFSSFDQWVGKASTWVNGGVCLDKNGMELKNGAGFMKARDEDRFPVTIMHRVGKKAAGRLLDGKEHNGFPELKSAERSAA